ncbi:MAG: hypothetical protein FWC84_07690, partial [Alphaproteobacteria bacterium]|nr:hypothetical protein [Alphaproteobacteria bacterium]
ATRECLGLAFEQPDDRRPNGAKAGNADAQGRRHGEIPKRNGASGWSVAVVLPDFHLPIKARRRAGPPPEPC